MLSLPLSKSHFEILLPFEAHQENRTSVLPW